MEGNETYKDISLREWCPNCDVTHNVLQTGALLRIADALEVLTQERKERQRRKKREEHDRKTKPLRRVLMFVERTNFKRYCKRDMWLIAHQFLEHYGEDADPESTEQWMKFSEFAPGRYRQFGEVTQRQVQEWIRSIEESDNAPD